MVSVQDYLKSVYGDVKSSNRNSKIISYIGMTFDFSVPGVASVTMSGYTEDVLKEFNVQGSVTTPALSNFFNVKEDSKLLNDSDREDFHSCVAKLAYMAKRTRPDILTAVSFLSTRVQKPNEQDFGKLHRLLKYLNGTKFLGIRFTAKDDVKQKDWNFQLESYVDASFAPHPDARSHSGIVIALGKGPVYVRSAKQRLVTKSSAEAELVALSDEVSQVMWCNDFLNSQGYQMPAAIVYEDNLATISMAKKG